jgi:site-specific recombinase XerD
MNEKAKPKKLLDQVRDVLRVKHYAYRTEKTYVFWIRRFILFHGKKHPADMGTKQIQEFLTHLAVERNVAASTQNQALNALIFVYKKVLCIELADPIDAVRARRPNRLPVVLSKQEAFKVIGLISR